MEPGFIHLRVHTEYSISDGLISIPDLFKQAETFKMPAIGITDQNNLFAAVKFYQAAFEAGIKPILGIDINVVDEDKNDYAVTLICQDNDGFKQLILHTTNSYLHGQQKGIPTIHHNWLNAENTKGLIALLGFNSDVGQAIINNELMLAETRLNRWKQLFADRLYLELTRTGRPQETTFIVGAMTLAEKLCVPPVATNDVRFINREDFEAHEARVAIQQGSILNDPARQKRYTEQQYLTSIEEMQELFKDIPEALVNSVIIAKKCNVVLELGNILLPHFPVPDNFTTETFLNKHAEEGLAKRLTHLKITDTAPYYARLKEELEVINRMGFAGYFLIVADFTKWAKENDIPVGPGRGSGPGSLVAYSLNITDLDPIQHELLFERFLNPERVSMPDFDIDFCMDGRDHVIQYVMQKHGTESVSQIMTYGTMAAKAVVRDVGRVLGHPYGFVDKIAKLIPFELGITLEKALENEPLLQERYQNEEEVKTLIDLAMKLEGVTRNVGKHAGGIVIAPGKLTNFVPLYCEPNESLHPVTQFDKDDVETVGLVKFDFLGLRTLTIIHRSLKTINTKRQLTNEEPIDIHLISLSDAETFNLLKKCQSTAIFQLESSGMRDLIKRLQPDCFDDLVALVALFRPGPLQSGMVDDFINRKHGRSKVSYPHPSLEPILGPTYGVILYQEQVMQIAQVLAGYTLGAADILRRAMGKKKAEEMASQREIFCQGAIARGVDAKTASHIFDLMEKFAGYGFNKSHSASYALLSYQTAWLKTHYPAAFMAAVLSSEMDKTEKIVVLIKECTQLKVQVLPPDINNSDYYFKNISDDKIMYGLGAIKGVGSSAIESIIETRTKQGPFQSLFDFCNRVDLRKVNKRCLEAFVKSGAFDCFQQHRAALFATLQKSIQEAEQHNQNKRVGQHDLFSFETVSTPYEEAEPFSIEILLQNEKETLGYYFSGHPMQQYINELKKLTTTNLALLGNHLNQTVKIAGLITQVRLRQTKRGDRMAIITVDDGESTIDVICFSDNFQKNREMINADNIVVIEGDSSIDEYSQSPRLILRSIYTIEKAREQFAKHIEIHLSKKVNVVLEELDAIFSQHREDESLIPIKIYYQEDNISATLTLGKRFQVTPTENFLAEMKRLLSPAEIAVVY